MTTLTQENELLIQSYSTVAFLTELKNLDFLKSDYYKNANFQDKFVKEVITRVGIDNQGSMLMVLYTMLVIPNERIKHRFPDEFDNLNKVVHTIKNDTKTQSNYKKDLVSINYIQHIRNSVAHANLSFVSDTEVVFFDGNESGDNCTITIPLAEFGVFLTALQKVFFKYVETLQLNNN